MTKLQFYNQLDPGAKSKKKDGFKSGSTFIVATN